MKRVLLFMLMFGFVFILLGELDFRVLPHEQRLDYEVDDDLLWRLKPNQQGFEWLAHMSLKSPPLTINNLGFRGKDVDLSNLQGKRILAVGSSSTLGTGVADSQAWSQVLEALLTQQGQVVTVMNGANPGWGPFQHAAFIKKEASIVHPDLMIVFASKSDLNFKPFKDEQARLRYLKQARQRKELLELSPFLTYSLRKVESFVRPPVNHLKQLLDTFKGHTPSQNEAIKDPYAQHTPYWQHIMDIADTLHIPTLFYVPNLEDDDLNQALYQRLQTLAQGKPYIYVHTLTLKSKDPLFNQEYLIAHDGHPNAKYHLAIAQDLNKWLVLN